MNPLLVLGLAVAGAGLISSWLPEKSEKWVTYAGLANVLVAMLSGAKFKLPKLER